MTTSLVMHWRRLQETTTDRSATLPIEILTTLGVTSMLVHRINTSGPDPGPSSRKIWSCSCKKTRSKRIKGWMQRSMTIKAELHVVPWFGSRLRMLEMKIRRFWIRSMRISSCSPQIPLRVAVGALGLLDNRASPGSAPSAGLVSSMLIAWTFPFKIKMSHKLEAWAILSEVSSDDTDYIDIKIKK